MSCISTGSVGYNDEERVLLSPGVESGETRQTTEKKIHRTKILRQTKMQQCLASSPEVIMKLSNIKEEMIFYRM